MKENAAGDVTEMLVRWSGGDAAALDEILPAVYHELRRIAAGHLRREHGNPTLQPTELVNEAYLRLVKAQGLDWQSRNHFYAISANLMRRVLVEHARAGAAAKRGGRVAATALDDALDVGISVDEDLIVLDEALKKLAERDPQIGRIVELRYFGGLTIDETARVLGMSLTGVKEGWAFARAWLLREMSPRA